MFEKLHRPLVNVDVGDGPQEAEHAGRGGDQVGGDSACGKGCQMAKIDPFLSLDCARVEGVGAQSKDRKGSNFAA